MKINNNVYSIFSSNVAPNPISVKYWADLSADPSGSVIKTYKNGKWESMNTDDELDADITKLEEDIKKINQVIPSKVDKVAGKELSTNDYTTEDKNKLAGLSNYDDTEIVADIVSLESTVAGLHNYDDSEVRDLIAALTLKVSTLEERVAALETPAA